MENIFFGLRLTKDELPTLINNNFYDLLVENKFLLIEGADLSDELLVKLALNIGTPKESFPIHSRSKNSPFIRVQFNGKQSNYNASYWHTDRNWGKQIAKATILQCYSAPIQKGKTFLFDTISTFNSLPDSIKSYLSTVRGYYPLNSYAKKNMDKNSYKNSELRMLEDFSEFIIATHPKSGDKGIYISERYLEIDKVTKPINKDLSIKESLVKIIEGGIVYQHEWKLGDILIWDNYSTLHKAEPPSQNSMKETHRIVVY